MCRPGGSITQLSAQGQAAGGGGGGGGHPGSRIANSIFNLIQRTGSGPLICNTDLGRDPTFVTLQIHTYKMYEQLDPS